MRAFAIPSYGREYARHVRASARHNGTEFSMDATPQEIGEQVLQVVARIRDAERRLVLADKQERDAAIMKQKAQADLLAAQREYLAMLKVMDLGQGFGKMASDALR